MSAEVVPLPVKEPSLSPILSLTAQAMNAVNAIILDRMQSEIPLIGVDGTQGAVENAADADARLCGAARL